MVLINNNSIVTFIGNVIIWILGISIVILPLIRSDMLVEPTQQAKYFFLAGSVLIIMLLIILQILIKRSKWVFKINVLDILIFTYLSYVSLNLLLIPTAHLDFRYLELVILGILYLIARNYYIKHRLLILFIIISGVVQMLHGEFQMAGLIESNSNFFKLTGGFFNPGPYAGFLVVTFAVSVFTYYFYSGWLKNVGLIATILILIILPATESRISWIAGLFIITAIFYLKQRRLIKARLRSFSLKKLTILSVLMITIIGLGIFSLYTLKKESVHGRLLVWKVTGSIAQEKPLLGFGYGSFKNIYMEKQADFIYGRSLSPSEQKSIDSNMRPYNEMLGIMAETGIAGLAIVLMIVFQIIRLPKNRETLMYMGIISTIAILSLTSYPSEILPIKLILIIVLAQMGKYLHSIIKFTGSQLLVRLLAVCLIIPVLFFYFIYNRAVFDKYTDWKVAKTHYSEGQYLSSLKAYLAIANGFEKEPNFLSNLSKNYYQLKKYDSSLYFSKKSIVITKQTNNLIMVGDAMGSMGYLDSALYYYRESEKMIPNRLFPKYLILNAYVSLADTANILKVSNEIINEPVYVQSSAAWEIKMFAKEQLVKYK